MNIENPVILVPFIIIAFIIFFTALWSFISFITSRLGGWHALAQHYQGEMSYYNKRYTWRSGRFGWGSYSGVLNFAVSDEDLGISVLFLYRAGHPPLKIPFEEIHGVEKTVFLPEVHYSFDRVPHRTLKIRKGFADTFVTADITNHDVKTRITISRELAQFVNDFSVPINKAWVIEKILTEISGNREFRKNDEVAPLFRRDLYTCFYASEITLEVTGRGIDLSNTYLHA